MNTQLSFSTLLILALTAPGIAQGQSAQSSSAQPVQQAGGTYFPPPIYSSGGSFSPATTAVEGALNGAGNLTKAMGEFNYNTAAGAVNAEQAASIAIGNVGAAAQTYFTLKQVNASYQAAKRGPRATEAQLVQISKITAPKRLTAYQLDPSTAAINWPAILERPEFAAQRKGIEELFAARLAENSGLGTPNYDQIVLAVSEFEASLKQVIDRITPAEYMSGRRFLTSLEYEARFAPGVEGVASGS